MGVNFLLGNSENTKPNDGRNTDISQYERYTENLSEIEANDYYFKKAYEWISVNTSDAIELYLLKVVNYFNYSNELATKSEKNTLFDIIMFISYYFILLIVKK